MAEVLVNENNEVLIEDNKAMLFPEPTKSWFYVTEYDSDGYPIKAKTIGCSGDMPYSYMYASANDSYMNVITHRIKDFEINEGVTSIGDNAFRKVGNLRSIKIPNSIIKINNIAFYFCVSLTSISLPNVTSIGNTVFYNCRSLTSITMPKVTSIGSQCFYDCKSCKLFDFRGATAVPTLSNTGSFTNTPTDKKIIVPDALYDEWITATNWSSTDYNIVSSIIKASDYEASL